MSPPAPGGGWLPDLPPTPDTVPDSTAGAPESAGPRGAAAGFPGGTRPAGAAAEDTAHALAWDTGDAPAGRLPASGWVPGAGTPPATPAEPGPAILETPGGAWLVGADPATGRVLAAFRPAGPQHATPTPAAVAAASGWALEAHLGFVLPDSVHTAVDTGAARLRPGSTAHGIQIPAEPDTTWEPAPAPAGGLAPAPASPVHLPDRTPQTYRRALATSRVLLRWDGQDPAGPGGRYRVEAVALLPTGEAGRSHLAYRLSHNDTVVFAGDDLQVPSELDVRDSDAVRALTHAVLAPPHGQPLTARQRAFLDRHTPGLAALVAETPGPLPAGARVEVRQPDGHLATGTVIAATAGPDGTVSSYAWRPDQALLPGHPGGLRLWVASPADAVRPSLLPPEDGLAGHDPRLPLAYGTLVAVLADDTPHTAPIPRTPPGPGGPEAGIPDTGTDSPTTEAPGTGGPAGACPTGRVIAAHAAGGRLTYTLRLTAGGAGTPPVTVDARDVTAVRGTAWATFDHQLRVRAAEDPDTPPQAGELLVAAEGCAILAADADGTLIPRPHGLDALTRNPAGPSTPGRLPGPAHLPGGPPAPGADGPGLEMPW